MGGCLVDDARGVQSIVRAFRLLELLADAPDGLSLGELSALVQLPAPTSHRLLKTMASLGYVRQLPSRRYGLGLRTMKLGQHIDLQLGAIAHVHLERIVEHVGETANLALLDGDRVVYVAQVPSPHAMRMFTEIGHRVYAHSTGVGKAILSTLDSETVKRIVTRAGMPRATSVTIVSLEGLSNDIDKIRGRGYAIDDGEQELGVRCYAVPIAGMPVPMALSVSGPALRLTPAVGEKAIPLLQAAAHALARDLVGGE